MEIVITGPRTGLSHVCAPILRALPDWFGIEAATQGYIQSIETLPTFLATVGGQPVGFLSLKQQNEFSSEIYVMGVLESQHRRGLGRALVRAAEEWLRSKQVEYLQVKTLGASHPDVGYARTRQFYLAMGFRPLEEFEHLWEGNPCLLMVKRL